LIDVYVISHPGASRLIRIIRAAVSPSDDLTRRKKKGNKSVETAKLGYLPGDRQTDGQREREREREREGGGGSASCLSSIIIYIASRGGFSLFSSQVRCARSYSRSLVSVPRFSEGCDKLILIRYILAEILVALNSASK